MLSSRAPFAIGLVPPDDAEYVAFMRRMRAQRPGRGGPRQAGEYLGGLVEQCARHYLGGFVALQEARILTWEQRLRNGRVGRLYRELDAVWTIDPESVCVFEIKFTFEENMARGVGLAQLRAAQELLFATNRYQYALLRLVYIGDEPLAVLDDLPALAAGDEWAELGVIWIPTQAIEAAAQELDIALPANWREPQAREGALETAEADEWRQFALQGEEGGSGQPGGTNPLALALASAGLTFPDSETDAHSQTDEADENDGGADQAGNEPG